MSQVVPKSNRAESIVYLQNEIEKLQQESVALQEKQNLSIEEKLSIPKQLRNIHEKINDLEDKRFFAISTA